MAQLSLDNCELYHLSLEINLDLYSTRSRLYITSVLSPIFTQFPMQPITKARPPLEFLAPRFTPWVLWLVRGLLPYWLRRRLQIGKIHATNVSQLLELFQQFQQEKVRLILAFRHPSTDDPFCLTYLLTKILPQTARDRGIALRSPIFAHFIYDRGIPLWYGKIVTWLFPRLGGIPIHRGKLDRIGLKAARDALVNGHIPLAIAPEGATNGHSELVSPLEPGVAQMGFWCQEDLVKAGRKEKVIILPIGIQYQYINEPWSKLEQLLNQLEQDCGLTPDRRYACAAIAQGDQTEIERVLYQRFYKLSQYLLYQMENFYAQFYDYPIPDRPELTEDITQAEIAQRLQSILDFALQVSESFFNLQPQGSKTDRCRRIEQVGWDWIYREELKTPHSLSTVSQKLADRIATEADLRMWHMRVVESFVSVTGSYVKDKPTIDRFAEITLLLWDLVARIAGENPGNRPHLGQRIAQITIGQPIAIAEYWEEYSSSRRNAKTAITDLTQALQQALEQMII